MSNDKQIEEMAKAICHAPTCEIRKNGGTCYKYCKAYIYAFRAINADYRKASDVAREIIDEIIRYTDAHKAFIARIPKQELMRFGSFLGELEKKYTEGEQENGEV